MMRRRTSSPEVVSEKTVRSSNSMIIYRSARKAQQLWLWSRDVQIAEILQVMQVWTKIKSRPDLATSHWLCYPWRKLLTIITSLWAAMLIMSPWCGKAKTSSLSKIMEATTLLKAQEVPTRKSLLLQIVRKTAKSEICCPLQALYTIKLTLAP